MKKQLLTSLYMATFLIACNQQQFDNLTTKNSLDAPEANAPVNLEGPVVIEEEQLIVAEDESIVIPTAIAGAYLTCAVEEFSQDPRTEGQLEVYCAVRSQENQSLVEISNLGTDNKWYYQGSENLEPKLQITSLPEHKQYHVRYQFRGLNAIEIQSVKTTGRFTLEFTQGDLVLATARSSARSLPYHWLKLDGGTLPPNAMQGGSEHMNETLLYLCRVYINDGIYPGKLIEHFRDATKTVCYTVTDNAAIESHTQDASTLLYESDALVLPAAESINRFRWVFAENGSIPEHAFAAGYTAAGDVLYICRNLESSPPGNPNDKPNDPSGEWTPGHIGQGSGGCSHEYYGVRTHSSYEVLVLPR